MDEAKKTAIQDIIDSEIRKFADAYETRFTDEIDNPDGVINSKKIIVLLLNWERNLCFTVHL